MKKYDPAAAKTEAFVDPRYASFTGWLRDCTAALYCISRNVVVSFRAWEGIEKKTTESMADSHLHAAIGCSLTAQIAASSCEFVCGQQMSELGRRYHKELLINVDRDEWEVNSAAAEVL